MNFEPYFVLYTLYCLKGILDVDMKLVEENVGENLCGVGLGQDFFGTILKAWPVKEEIDKLVVIKIQKFWYLKITVKGMKANHRKCLLSVYWINDLFNLCKNNSQNSNNR